ncbi:DUF5698 domain-containing protein [Vallitalea sp.]|uniref:DUF5698 domain-containing protein n=1 Tax=Vallitalea sp. TaxID=1882829 RepID=UPI0025CC5A34|nr:DUF5698 domain-containing protein [Vallitalea sp.]MCT4686893.1 DUF5698 domain-containing protein [Vallitalea sp.]
MKTIIFIIILQLLYVPLLTMRTIFMVKHNSFIASAFGFFEAAVYIFGLSLVISGNQTFLTMFIYALSFGVGIYIGNLIEKKLAIGHITYNISLKHENQLFIDKLREQGFRVTIFEGIGKECKRYKLEILIDRHLEDELWKLVKTYEPEAFITSYEPRKFKRRHSQLLK